MKLEIEAQGPADLTVTRLLKNGDTLRLGRSPKDGWGIPWDMSISREHADLTAEADALLVQCVASARNPILFQQQRLNEAVVPVGSSFTIGKTVFRVLPSLIDDSLQAEEPLTGKQHAFSAVELRETQFGDIEQQMEVLSNIPALISQSTSDEDLAVMLVSQLLQAIPKAMATAVVQFDETLFDDSQLDMVDGEQANTSELPHPTLLRVDRRDDMKGRFLPSRRLMLQALQTQESVMHVWSGEGNQNFTISDELGWAFCAPIPGDSCRGWCLYVSGAGTRSGAMLVTEEELKGDLRFTELVAQFFGSVRRVRALEEHKTQLSAFFSPKVIESLTGRSASNALVPAERDITVLFCDVRGFSRKSEQLQNDLHALLRTASEALGVMTNNIIDHDGAIADFQGDAVLGFWGWPVAHAEGAIPACRAALSIYLAFLEATNDPQSLLHGFSVGIGIAHGQALAGQIGTKRQSKVGVFGPVVNQGARIESMSKQLGVPICIDEQTADSIRTGMPEDEVRLRRLIRVRPQGMETPVTVFGLLPAADESQVLSDEAISVHDAAFESFVAGHWAETTRLLEQVPPEDGPANFLRNFIAQQNSAPPPDWDGVVSLTRK